MQSHNLQLAKGGTSTPVGPDEPLSAFLHRHGFSSSYLMPTLSLHNICTVSDVYYRQISPWFPVLKQLLQTTSLSAQLPNLPESLPPTIVRIGQLWHTRASSLTETAFTEQCPHGVVFEIRGWVNASTMAVQLWTSKDPARDIISA